VGIITDQRGRGTPSAIGAIVGISSSSSVIFFGSLTLLTGLHAVANPNVLSLNATKCAANKRYAGGEHSSCTSYFTPDEDLPLLRIALFAIFN
jgi:hypothetical protein